MKTEDIDKIIAEALEKEKDVKRSPWHRPSDDKQQQKRDHIQRVRNMLNTVFMLAFVAAIILYFLLPNDRTAFFCVGFGAIILKIVEFALRFMF